MSRLLRSRLAWTLLVLTPAALLTLYRPPARADEPKAAAEDAALKAADALYDGIREEKLDNGFASISSRCPVRRSSPRWWPIASARPTKISTTPACRTISNI